MFVGSHAGFSTARLSGAFALASLGIALFALTGCTGRSVYQMDTGYEKTSLPVHFDRDPWDDQRFVSVSLSETRRQRAAFRGGAFDSTHFSFVNAGSSVDGNLVWEFEGHHLGFGFGVSPQGMHLLRLGGFWGYSLTFNRLLLSGTGGLFLNNNENHARYEEWGFFALPQEEAEFHGNNLHMEMPLRANAGLDLPGPMTPYFSYSFNLLAIGIRDGREVLSVHEGASGILLALPARLTMRLEASAMRAWMQDERAVEGDRSTRLLPGARVELGKGF
jgi:hypothetical protein